MFFSGIPTVLVRIAYLLTVISFVMTPVHIFAASGSIDTALLIFSGVVFVFCLLVGVLHKPRKIVLILYALFAWIIHGLMSPVL